VLRKQGQENELFTEPDRRSSQLLFRMPLLCGDNPLSNTVPSKFLRLTDTMLFLLRQWADGLFINEQREGIDPGPQLRGAGAALDRGALSSGLGGSFCPGGEAGWIMRNPAIYAGSYRIRQAPYQPGALSQPATLPGGAPATAADLATGLEPGDLTKYSAVPWQSDFNECTNQPIDVTYAAWNNLEPASTGDPVAQRVQLTYWWPAHRPVWVNGAQWSPTPQNNAGDLQMVTAWSTLGFVVKTQDPNNPIDVVEAGGTGV
jgi:L-lysine epsilon oxidase-like protein